MLSLDRYVVIKIPLIPYPKNVLGKVYRLLGTDSLEMDKAGLPLDVLNGLAAAGLIRISSKRIVRPLEGGRKLYQILSRTGVT